MDQRTWNLLVQAHAPQFGAFLQSWEWGEFQKSLGREVVRIHEEVDGAVVLATAMRLPLPFGQSYWLVPKGPLGDASPSTMRAILRDHLKGAAFIRTEGDARLPGAVKTKDTHPGTTLVLDMHKGCTGLLDEMEKKTRYNVRVGEKKGVVTGVVGLDKFDAFVTLMNETTARNQFSAHEPAYYKKMLEFLQGGDCHAFMALARVGDQPLAANIMIDFLDTRVYLHGASSSERREVQASHALQFSLIQSACEAGKHYYDFWGIAPPDSDESHPWAGITRFKSGFGGHVITMPGTFDVPTNPLVYGAYRLSKMIKR